MKILGIYDWHNSGAALVEDGKIIAAIEKERLSRNKIEFGMPVSSVDKIFEMTNTHWQDIEAIAVPGLRDPIPFARWNTAAFKFKREMGLCWNIQYTLWRIIYALRQMGPMPKVERYLNRRIVVNKINKIADFDEKRIYMIDHHLAHAASGYRTSGFSQALVLVLDGSGDGHSCVVFKGVDGELQFLAGSDEKASLGKLYSNVTLGLGFKKISDEGKVMGLAAYGDPSKFYCEIDKVIKIKDIDTLHMEATEDLLGNSYAKKIKRLARRYSREDISAAVQRKLEATVTAIVRHFVNKTNIRKIVLAGGVASNVKMNQSIREMDCVEDVFVFPNMTDGGLCAGAALEVCYNMGKEKDTHFMPYKLEHVYLGPEYSNSEIKTVIDANGLKAEFVEDIDCRIGELVAEGSIVARFSGRMEYGPRALGNRSILARANNPEIEDVLNRRLRRDEFMPFAPSLLTEYAGEYLRGCKDAPYMTETFSVSDVAKRRFPAVVHVDSTLRPQTVDGKTNPGYRKVIETLGRLAGDYLLLNTSFNMHGEPIICSPQDAINAFNQGCVDYLAMGNWLLKYSETGGLKHEIKRRYETKRHYEAYNFDFDTPVRRRTKKAGLLGKAIKEIENGPRQVVADVGCGVGTISALIKESSPSNPIGMDISLNSLIRAKQKHSVRGVCADNINLPFKDVAIDWIISNGVIHHTPDAYEAFKELVRTLKRGGKVFLSVYNRASVYHFIYKYIGGWCRHLRNAGHENFLKGICLPLFYIYIYAGQFVIQKSFRKISRDMAWNLFNDHLLSPRATFHTSKQVLNWAAENGLVCEARKAETMGYMLSFIFKKCNDTTNADVKK